MASFDSDDSLSDQGNYTETNVLLGYASKEPTDDTISHLGGFPDFLSPAHPPPGAFSTCKVCLSRLSLLLQLHGDLPKRFPNNERRLYLFACRKKQCMRKTGSIRGYRETRRWRNSQVKTEKRGPSGKDSEGRPSQTAVTASTAKTYPEPPMGGDMGGLVFNSSGPFGKPTGGVQNSNPFSMNGAGASSTPALSNPFGPPQTTSGSPNNTGQSSDRPTDLTPQTNALSDGLPPPSTLVAKPPQPPSPPKSHKQSVPMTTANSNLSPLPETFASKLRLSSQSNNHSSLSPQNSTPWPPHTSFPLPYPTYHLDADYETLDPEPSTQPSTSTFPTSSSKYDSEDTPISSHTTDKASLMDSSMDKTFQHFSDRLAQNPEQVLRYEFGGFPLLYSSTDAVASRFPSGGATVAKMPNCESCGSRRVFELQLVPGAITALEEDEDGEDGAGRGIGIGKGIGTEVDEGMEWGTVILGVCERDCCGAETAVDEGQVVGEGKSSWREEWVGVQWEERVVRK